MSTLKDLKEKLEDRRNRLMAAFKEAKVTDDDGRTTYDFRKVKSLDVGNVAPEARGTAVAEKIAQLNAEINDLTKQVEALEAAERIAKDIDAKGREVRRVPIASDERQVKSLEDAAAFVAKTPEYKAWLEKQQTPAVDLGVRYGQIKTMSTSNGFPPDAHRTGEIVDKPIRPVQIIDIIPFGRTSSGTLEWHELVTRTQAAAETAETIPGPEADLVYVKRTTGVSEIVVEIPVTEIQLEDVPFIESEISRLLTEDVRERLDRQIVAGDGTGENLRGILNTSGVLTQARGTDPAPDAILKAMTLVKTGAARVQPTHVLLHPTDYQNLRLLRDANGNYLFGPPSTAGEPRIWGRPIIENEALPQGTALVGAFTARTITVYERRPVTINYGYSNDDFSRRQKRLQASLRAGLMIKMASAFATVTGL